MPAGLDKAVGHGKSVCERVGLAIGIVVISDGQNDWLRELPLLSDEGAFAEPRYPVPESSGQVR